MNRMKSSVLLVIVGWLCSGSQGAIPTITYNSACDDEQNVYADYINQPQLLGTNLDWRTSISVQVPTMTKVLSVSCKNKGGPAGILGSTADTTRILTNTNQWKCSTALEDGWNTADFDDSHWANAVQVDTNEHPVHWGWKSHTNPAYGPVIKPEAVYIGAQGVDYHEGVTSYCRIKMVYPFTMGCDDYSDLYADGVWIGNQTLFTEVSDPFEIPKLATTFAVQCANKGAFHAFLGSTADGSLITDSQWKVYYQKRTLKGGDLTSVNPVPPENWFQPDFDDSKWAQAMEVLDNVGPRASKGPSAWTNLKPHPEISSNAWWISGALQDKDNSRGGLARDNDRSINYFRRNLDCMWTDSCQSNGPVPQ